MEGTALAPETLETTGRNPLSVGVMVLNYNTWDIALRAMDAAVQLSYLTVTEFVLFDDGSPTPPPEGIDPRIKVVLGGVNRGFAKALVVAFAQMTSDIVVLFDSDAYPLNPFAEQVRAHFEADERLGQIGFQAFDENGVPPESYYSEPTKWSLILGQGLYARVPHKPLGPSNLCAMAGCMALRMTTYAQVGGIDGNFDMLDLDLDYSMRVRRGGWRVIPDKSLKVFHVGGGTPQLARKRILRWYKCRWYLLRKHGLIKSPRMAKALILARLHVEKLILLVFGKFRYKNPEVYADKLIGRQDLITYCSENYR
jgi:GT2 family glycosyltransferase